jgi:hypothetical protein
MIVKAEGPSGPAKIHSDDPKHALGLLQYLRTIGYNAWVEDTNGNEIDEKALDEGLVTRTHAPLDAAPRPASAGGRCRPSAALRVRSVNGPQHNARPQCRLLDLVPIKGFIGTNSALQDK